MAPTTLTLISGVVLLLVFGLVGWNIQRRETARDRKGSGTDEKESP